MRTTRCRRSMPFMSCRKLAEGACITIHTCTRNSSSYEVKIHRLSSDGLGIFFIPRPFSVYTLCTESEMHTAIFTPIHAHARTCKFPSSKSCEECTVNRRTGFLAVHAKASRRELRLGREHTFGCTFGCVSMKSGQKVYTKCLNHRCMTRHPTKV